MNCPACHRKPTIAWFHQRKFGHYCRALERWWFWAKFGSVTIFADYPDQIQGEARV